MSQWIALSFLPPVEEYELPTARWTVPSIFSSNATFFMKRWMPGLQPIPSSPSRRAPSSVSSMRSRNSSPLAPSVDDASALEDEAHADDLVAVVDGRELAELDDALGRVLDG